MSLLICLCSEISQIFIEKYVLARQKEILMIERANIDWKLPEID